MFLFKQILHHHPPSAYLSIFVTVAPTRNDLTVSRPAVLTAGGEVNITCETDSSNPPVDIRWSTRTWENFNATVETPRSPPKQYTTRDRYHGATTTSVLSLTLHDEDFGQNVTCGVYWNDTEVAQELRRSYTMIGKAIANSIWFHFNINLGD